MFWNNYVNLCIAKKESPNGVAATLGFSNAACTKWKRGATPGGKSLQKIAEYFGVTTDSLIGVPAQSQDENDVILLISKLTDLTDEQKNTFARLFALSGDNFNRAMEILKLFLDK